MRKVYRIAVLVVLLQIVMIAIGPPEFLGDWLNLSSEHYDPQPRYVVVLGGSGVPSGPTLVRCYLAAQLGRGMTNATFIVALPTDSDPEASHVGRMRDELVMRGIPASSVTLAGQGHNTRQQATHIASLIGHNAMNQSVLVVSSHYHTRRGVLCFRKAGFANVTGVSPETPEEDAPPGAWAWLRYGIWKNASDWIFTTRELLAWLVTNVS